MILTRGARYKRPELVVTLIGKVPSSPICIMPPDADLHLMLEGVLFSISFLYLSGTKNPAVFPVSTTASPNINVFPSTFFFRPVVDRVKTLSMGNIHSPTLLAKREAISEESLSTTIFSPSLFLLF